MIGIFTDLAVLITLTLAIGIVLGVVVIPEVLVELAVELALLVSVGPGRIFSRLSLTSALTLTLGPDAPGLADAAPQALARRLIEDGAGKAWVSHPLLDRWLAAQAARWKRLWR